MKPIIDKNGVPRLLNSKELFTELYKFPYFRKLVEAASRADPDEKGRS
ncbi:hypothetical protein [Sphingomonas alba]|uniref:Uncharacterized protein n=1 Tax=Sphingomonas alba TaxID=2908208 RepID=A0ABT0RNE6_9SPHN|nr:hypothetical protein [Sphingomonas alba]MCL6684095.1 hypothetical protein [Sphingomonas alba]